MEPQTSGLMGTAHVVQSHDSLQSRVYANIGWVVAGTTVVYVPSQGRLFRGVSLTWRDSLSEASVKDTGPEGPSHLSK